MFYLTIPEISDEELLRRYSQIKPIVKVDGVLYYLKDFSLDSLKKDCFLDNYKENVTGRVGENLIALEGQDFICIHGPSTSFKPTISEVLAQIAPGKLDLVEAFRIVRYPTNIDTLFDDSIGRIILKSGFHPSLVRLYGSSKS